LSNRVSNALNNCLDFVRQMGSQPCLLCGASSLTGVLCAGCQADLPRLDTRRCPQCALPTPDGEICGACLRQPPTFSHSESVYRYDHPLDSLIHALKYSGQLAVARYLAEHLAQRLQDLPRPDILLPMPLHPKRLRERGFNQAALIAGHLAQRLDLKMDARACRRLRDTPPQVGLALRERRRNMRGAFHCELRLDGCRVALVDDVMTTGASLDALARAIKQAGASDIATWTIARAIRS
jgi:ComF family protein